MCAESDLPQRKPAFATFANKYVDQEYSPVSRYGYSCQTWLAKKVNQLLHSGSCYCWFATSFNAYRNGDDSNPLWLYMTIDRAVRQEASNNAKIKDVRANLMRAVEKELLKQNRNEEIGATQKAIFSAPVSWFRPEIWRLELGKIVGRSSANHQYKDECLIPDLKSSEFEIIIE